MIHRGLAAKPQKEEDDKPRDFYEARMGNSDAQVISAIGHGAMSLCAYHIGKGDEESLKVFTHAAGLRCT